MPFSQLYLHITTKDLYSGLRLVFRHIKLFITCFLHFQVLYFAKSFLFFSCILFFLLSGNLYPSGSCCWLSSTLSALFYLCPSECFFSLTFAIPRQESVFHTPNLSSFTDKVVLFKLVHCSLLQRGSEILPVKCSRERHVANCQIFVLF